MKKAICILLTLVMAFSLCTVAFAEAPADAADEAYYSETNTKSGEDAATIIEDEEVREAVLKRAKENDWEILSVTTETVYVKDGYTKDGTYENRPMTAAEVAAYKHAANLIAPLAISNPRPLVKGKLTITLTAYTNARHEVILSARADWGDVTIFSDQSKVPAAMNDTITIYWGGSGGLKAKGVSVLAYYSDGTKMPYDIADQNNDSRYSWSFLEKKTTQVMDYMDITMTLGPGTTLKNTTTSATMQYTHTYYVNNGSTAIPNSWTISIQASGLPY